MAYIKWYYSAGTTWLIASSPFSGRRELCLQLSTSSQLLPRYEVVAQEANTRVLWRLYQKDRAVRSLFWLLKVACQTCFTFAVILEVGKFIARLSFRHSSP